MHRKLSIAHFLVTFAGLAACFVWLILTNEGGSATSRGGMEVTYFPPLYAIMGIAGQLIALMPLHSSRSVADREGTPARQRLVMSIPVVIGVALIAGSIWLAVTMEASGPARQGRSPVAPNPRIESAATGDSEGREE